jgi:hypothetical protein
MNGTHFGIVILRPLNPSIQSEIKAAPLKGHWMDLVDDGNCLPHLQVETERWCKDSCSPARRYLHFGCWMLDQL